MRHLFYLAFLLLVGCASAPPVPQPVTRPAGAELQSFTLNGRISVKHNEGRTTSSVNWVHRSGEDEILLLSPLGQTMARIVRDADGVELEAKDKYYAAEDAGELTQQVLGWRLPLDGLQYWVLALPVPESKVSIENDANGRVSVIKQDGWEIRYTRYAAETPDSLPLRLILKREKVEIQLLVDEWEIK